MGSDNSVQFYSKDGSVYIYRSTEKQWYKFSPTDVLPLDVKNQVRELKEKADLLKDD
jgi:hypothetical protein